MYIRCIVCSSVITAVLGAILGVAIAEISQHDLYQENTHRNYALIGAGAGLVVGAGQEAIRQIIQADREAHPNWNYTFEESVQDYRRYLEQNWKDS